MPDFRIDISPTESYRLPMLSARLDAAFDNVYRWFRLGAPFKGQEFLAAAVEYLTSHPQDWAAHDMYFYSFTPLWSTYVREGNWQQASLIWKVLFAPANDSESAGVRVHKGAGFYFLGMTQISCGNIEGGYLSMHNALEEDIETHGAVNPATPSYRLIVLDQQHPDQAFRDFVVLLSGLLDERLKRYRTTTGLQLTLDGLRGKFLSEVNLRDTAFLFSFSQARFEYSTSLVGDSGAFAAQIIESILFDLCLVIEELVQWKEQDLRGKRFIQTATFLAARNGFALTQDDLGHVNGQFRLAYGGYLQQVLDGQALRQSDAQPLSFGEIGLVVTYGIRNRAAHSAGSSSVVAERWREISDHVFNTLFRSIEALY